GPELRADDRRLRSLQLRHPGAEPVRGRPPGAGRRFSAARSGRHLQDTVLPAVGRAQPTDRSTRLCDQRRRQGLPAENDDPGSQLGDTGPPVALAEEHQDRRWWRAIGPAALLVSLALPQVAVSSPLVVAAAAALPGRPDLSTYAGAPAAGKPTEVAQQPFGLAVFGRYTFVADPANHVVRMLI